MGNCCQTSFSDVPQDVLDSVPMYSFEGLTLHCLIYDVYDGDTCTIMYSYPTNLPFSVERLQKRRLRLSGIDTPELRTKNQEEKTAGYEAKTYLSKLIKNKIVTIKFEKEEKFGRLMGYIFLNIDGKMGKMINVNQLMIEKGYAKEYHGEKKIPF